MRQRASIDYEASNGEAATVILADVQQYGGPESGLVRWALAWQARRVQQPVVASSGQPGAQMALFEMEAAR